MKPGSLIALAVLATAAASVALVFSPRKGDDPRGRVEREAESNQMNSGRNVIDPARTSGSDIFSPEMRDTRIDGKVVSYQAMIMWCGEAEPGPEDTFVLRDVRILVNPEPRTRSELEGLFTVGPASSAKRVGEEIRQRLESCSGILAGRAVLHGGTRLSDANRVQLRDGVTAIAIDPDKPSRRGRLETPALDLTLANGRITRAENNDEVKLTMPQGEIRGRGLVADLEADRLELSRHINMTLADLGLLGRSGPPVTITSDGPLVHQARRRPDDEGARRRDNLEVLLHADGKSVFENGVRVVQGASWIRGDRLVVESEGDPTGSRPPEITRARLVGNVDASTGEGRFRGGLARFTKGDDATRALELEGPGLSATLSGVADALPVLGISGDLTVTTTGKIRIDHFGTQQPRLAKVAVGPDVIIVGQGHEVSCWMLRFDVVHIPENREGAGNTAVSFPAWVQLAGRVRGDGSRGKFSAGSVTYTREHDAVGMATLDRIVLLESPDVTWKLGGGEGPPPEGLVAELRAAPGVIRIRADERIEVTRDPLQRKPLVAAARGAVSVHRRDAEDELLARLSAEEVDLRVAPRWRADTPATGRATAFVSSQVFEHVAAKGSVTAGLIGKAEAKGQVLEYDATSGNARLEDTRPTRRGEVTVTDEQGQNHVIAAAKVLFQSNLGQLVASGGTLSRLLVRRLRLPGIGDVSSESVPTIVRADRLSASLARGGAEGTSGIIFREILAETGVDIAQGEFAHAVCSYARLDLQTNTGVVRGAPARIDVTRNAEGKTWAEFVSARVLTLKGEEAFLEGDVLARFHTSRRRLAMSLATAPAATVAKEPEVGTTALVPVDVRCAGDLFLSQDRILLREAARVVQGDPTKEGFDLGGDRMILVLLPSDEPGAGSKVDVARAVVEGSVDFASRDLVGKGEVMVFDRRERYIQLSSKEKKSTLNWRGRLELPRYVYLLDFSDPQNPVMRSARPKDGERGR